MEKELIHVLDNLANKLETTTEHLWGILIKQAPISAASDLIAALFFAVFIVVTFIFTKYKTEDGSWDAEAWLIWFVASFISMIFISIGVYEAMIGFVNPEYWALKKILGI